VILSRSIAGALAAIPSAAGISLAPIGFMMSDGTAHACPKEAVVPDEMPGDAADHRSFYASRRLGWAGRQTDNGKHRGCRNEDQLHEHLLKTGWLAHWSVEPPFDGHLNPATALKCARLLS
jgi:hypothetical protein